MSEIGLVVPVDERDHILGPNDASVTVVNYGDSQMLGNKVQQGARTEVKQEYGQTRSLDGITIARAEMARRRRKLGTLTHGQEVAIENLLLSTANKISELVGRALDADT